jgi:hypothetical protein
MLVSPSWLSRDGQSILDSWDKSQTSVLVQSAAANIQESGFDLGTWLAELSSTRRMFESNAQRLREWFDRHQKLLASDAANVLGRRKPLPGVKKALIAGLNLGTVFVLSFMIGII